jgi:translation initiation factor IF-2
LAKAKRVFELAKELGVKSKAIVEKCQAEDVPGITNHMSTVKLGLAETVRQWFAGSDDEGRGTATATATATAVETSEKVDLKKVKKQATRRKKVTPKADADVPADLVSPEVVAIEEAPAAPAAKKKVRKKKAADTLPLVEAELDSPPVADVAASAGVATPEVPPATAAEAPPRPPEDTGPLGKPNVPDRPKEVTPVGEQLKKPQQVQLKGPKVVRIEKPEPVTAQRPRPKRNGGPGGARSGDGADVMPGEVPGISRSRGPARGRGAGGPGTGGGIGEGKPKRRSSNTRRGRSADALPTGPSKFSQADMEELDARLRGATGFLKQRRRDLRKRENVAQTAQSAVVTGGVVEISEPVTIKNLSSATGIKTAEIIKYLFNKGNMATINSAIDTETAMEVAMEYNIELQVKQQETAEQLVLKEFENREAVDVRPRPSVVTVLGHVDHGKTSLLDRIREADVAAHEAGGITQHIGAYRVTIRSGEDDKTKTVVFLDTPGHEAFTSMRSRGATMTDLVVLVVAADDGVMPQTIESINHAKAAGVPIIVALNKIDVAQATEENIRKIYGQLAEHGLNPVEWGGDTEVVKTSAETGTGVTDLVEVLDYQAELLELKADYGGAARGTVIEAQMQPGRGSVARVLVQEGQINVGDYINIGRAFGRVRDMTDDRNRSIKQAGPATPLELSGIGEIPDAGNKFYVTDSLQKAEQVALQYREAERVKQMASQTKVTLDNFAATIKAGQTRDLRVVLKADVQGSVDVLQKCLEELGNDEVAVKVLHSAVGGISESDIVLAGASDAVVIGFHVAVTPAVRAIAESHTVDIRLYRVIYDLTDEIKKALEGMLEPEKKEEEIGTAQVRQVFKISKLGFIAGCLVTDGAIQKSAMARLVRDGVVVTDNREIESLRRVKDEAKEVRAGTECGIRLAGFEDIKPDDLITCYKVTQVKRTLD